MISVKNEFCFVELVAYYSPLSFRNFCIICHNDVLCF